MSAVDAGLAGEYAAIYAYGAAAVHLEGPVRETADALEAEHRERRDALLDYCGARGLDAGAAEPGYDLAPIADAEGAQALLLEVEERLTTVWRAGLASTEPDEREICLDMYTASAQALARLRQASGEPVADPWPGRPED